MSTSAALHGDPLGAIQTHRIRFVAAKYSVHGIAWRMYLSVSPSCEHHNHVQRRHGG